MSDDTVARCLAGWISPEVALARLLLDGTAPDQVALHVAGCREEANPNWQRLASLVAGGRDGMSAVSALVHVAGIDHTTSVGDPLEAVASIAALFDRAVAVAPLASVAAYSLDDPVILDAATGELSDWLVAESLVEQRSDVLDLGCGIGRVGAALAPRCASVLGLDVSAGMLDVARQRHAGIGNLRFQHTDGMGLPDLPACFDLVLAVDSFPYLVQAGAAVAERHVADAARLLRPGGALAILNLSYRGDEATDRADVARWAVQHGLSITSCGDHPFRLWDAGAYVLRKPG